jgi:hypothetical protein
MVVALALFCAVRTEIDDDQTFERNKLGSKGAAFLQFQQNSVQSARQVIVAIHERGGITLRLRSIHRRRANWIGACGPKNNRCAVLAEVKTKSSVLLGPTVRMALVAKNMQVYHVPMRIKGSHP